MKRCARCQEDQSAVAFHRDKRRRDGLAAYCRACKATVAKEERARNAPQIKARRKAKYARNREQAILDARAWATEHPERRQEVEAAYRARNRERVARHNREYYARHLEASRARARLARQRRRLIRSTPEGIEFAQVVVCDPCAYCGSAGGTVDHITPLSGGGNSDWLNLTGACGTCNRRKGTKPLLDYLLRSTAEASVMVVCKRPTPAGVTADRGLYAGGSSSSAARKLPRQPWRNLGLCVVWGERRGAEGEPG